MKQKFWTSDKIVSFTAVFISLATLYIFIRQTNIIEKQSRLYVMPYLRAQMINDNSAHFTRMELHNYGVGPAIIESREIFYNDKWNDIDFGDFYFTMVPEMEDVDIVMDANLSPGQAIAAGSSRLLVQLCEDAECHQKMKSAMGVLMNKKFDYRIVYRSIYGDRWVINSSGEAPTLLEEE